MKTLDDIRAKQARTERSAAARIQHLWRVLAVLRSLLLVSFSRVKDGRISSFILDASTDVHRKKAKKARNNKAKQRAELTRHIRGQLLKRLGEVIEGRLGWGPLRQTAP